jgi:hypothetical protein
VRTTASANSRPTIGDGQPVAVRQQQTVSHHGLGAFAFSGAQPGERQPLAQPGFQQHVFGVQGPPERAKATAFRRWRHRRYQRL